MEKTLYNEFLLDRYSQRDISKMSNLEIKKQVGTLSHTLCHCRYPAYLKDKHAVVNIIKTIPDVNEFEY